MYPSFVCIAQKVNRAKLIDNENTIIIVRGRECCGECAAKRETFVGWRVQLVRRLQQAHTGACRCGPQGCTT